MWRESSGRVLTVADPNPVEVLGEQFVALVRILASGKSVVDASRIEQILEDAREAFFNELPDSIDDLEELRYVGRLPEIDPSLLTIPRSLSPTGFLEMLPDLIARIPLRYRLEVIDAVDDLLP